MNRSARMRPQWDGGSPLTAGPDHSHVTATPERAVAVQVLCAVTLPKVHKARPRYASHETKQTQSSAVSGKMGKWHNTKCQREEPVVDATSIRGLMLTVSARDDPFVDLRASLKKHLGCPESNMATVCRHRYAGCSSSPERG